MTGWRALLRVARREALRHKGRSALVALLVALPVAAMTLALTLGRTAEPTAEQQAAGELGQADLSIMANGVEPDRWQGLLPTGSRWLAVVQQFNGAAAVRDGEAFQAPVVEADLGDPMLAGRYELVGGRAAGGPDEVVLSQDLAGALGVAVGDRLELRRPRRTVTVTGTAITPTALGVPFLVVAPGWSGAAPVTSQDGTVSEWLVDLGGAEVDEVAAALEQAFPAPESERPPEPGVAPGDATQPRFLNVLTRSHLLAGNYSNRTGTEVSATLVVGVLALVWTGAVAASAFAVGARRRLREVGLVAASGGAPRQLTGLGLADGVVLGCTGAAAGVLAGLAGAGALRPQVGRIFGQVSGPFRVPLAAVAAAAAVGTLAALLAAVAPALGAARVPVLAALAGLRPGRTRHRSWLALGVVALSAGLSLCWRGSATRSQTVVIAGVLLVVLGVAATSGPLLSALGRAAGRAPLALRLAARDASRARSRAAPATVAAMLSLAGAVGGMTMVYSARAETLRRYVPVFGDDQLSVSFEGRPVPPQEVADLLTAMGEAVPGSVGVLAQADLPGAGSGGGLAVVGGAGVQGLAVGDASTLDALGASSAWAAFEAGKVVALGRRVTGGEVQLIRPPADGAFVGPLAGGRLVDGRRPGAQPAPSSLGPPLRTVPAVEADVPRRQGTPAYLISAPAAESLGLDVSVTGALVRAPGPVSESDVRKAQLVALDTVPSAPTNVQREEGPCCGEDWVVAAAMAGMAAAVALVVVALVTALGAEELRPHLATLAAVGAAPRTRRRLGAAQAGLMAGLAGVLAVPAGLLPAVALLVARPPALGVGDVVASSNLVVVPWLLIAALAVGITAVGTLTGGLLGGGRRTIP